MHLQRKGRSGKYIVISDGLQFERHVCQRVHQCEHEDRQLAESTLPLLSPTNTSAPFTASSSVFTSRRSVAKSFFCSVRLSRFSHCIAAVLRGSGHAAVPMIVMLCDWCLFRVSYITVAVRLISDIRVIFWAYPLTWSISSVIFLYLFLRGKWVYGFEKEK